ncbi:hypothetical protein D9M72_456730 [compost metagenome]
MTNVALPVLAGDVRCRSFVVFGDQLRSGADGLEFARSDVHRFGLDGGGDRPGNNGRRDVVDQDEVTAHFAVLVKGDRLAAHGHPAK